MIIDFAAFDISGTKPLYIALYEAISLAVKNGKIKKGERLPSVREAANLLGVSRTTVENAYEKLCIEGIAESFPQKGYYIVGAPVTKYALSYVDDEKKSNILYDFSSRKTDASVSDVKLWKKNVRSALNDPGELISYGDSRGEPGLRYALANYSYKARGVIASPDNIVIGAGMGPLLNMLCGITGRNIKVGFENGGFSEAKRIFDDHGIKNIELASDKNGVTGEALASSECDVLFMLPSAMSKISVASVVNRRKEISGWLSQNENRFVIEDDYNGELRYTARTIPCFQKNAEDRTVYIGSFSKLLLPSVRIAYMVLPPRFSERLKKDIVYYNQTCGKIEQLALEKYIVSGAMEKQLKKLRHYYYEKSRILIKSIETRFDDLKSITLLETSLAVEIRTNKDFESAAFCQYALNNGIKVAQMNEKGAFKLFFAGIPTEDIQDAVLQLCKLYGNNTNYC